MARKRIDRNNYDPERVLEIVREQTDHDEQSPLLGTDELLRLLGESAHAYLLLRRDALELYARLKERVRELERNSRVERVLALHEEWDEQPVCRGCGSPWPCPTVRALEGEE